MCVYAQRRDASRDDQLNLLFKKPFEETRGSA